MRPPLQDTAGSREDLLASLILDPSNEECLPLIARVFPGKSKATLLQSGDAVTVETRLKLDIQSSSPKKGASRSDAMESDLPYRIDLKFAEEGMADEGDLPTRAGQFSRSTVQWESTVPHSPPGKGWGSQGKQHSEYVHVRLGNTYSGCLCIVISMLCIMIESMYWQPTKPELSITTATTNELINLQNLLLILELT